MPAHTMAGQLTRGARAAIDGQRGTRHERLAVLHHLRNRAAPRRKAHCLWKARGGHGRELGAKDFRRFFLVKLTQELYVGIPPVFLGKYLEG